MKIFIVHVVPAFRSKEMDGQGRVSNGLHVVALQRADRIHIKGWYTPRADSYNKVLTTFC